MNGVFNSGLTFWQLIITFLTAIFGLAAIKVTFNFDLNKYLESRRKSYTQKLKNACCHVRLMQVEGGAIRGESLYISPPGTLQWQCQRCGDISYDRGNDFEERIQYYLENIDEYNNRNKKFQKLLKKSGQI